MPHMTIDPDGELAWFVIPVIVGAITGTINAVSNYESGDNFWDVAGSFGVGFVAGAGATLGAVAIAPAATAALGTGFAGGAAIGATGGAISGFTLGAGNTWLGGGSFGQGLGNGFIGAGTGALVGGVTGGLIQGTSSAIQGRNFWSGAHRPIPTLDPLKPKGADLGVGPKKPNLPNRLNPVGQNTTGSQIVQSADDPLGANGLRIGQGDFAGKSITTNQSTSRLGHVFRDAPGHVNPSTATSQGRYLQLFQDVASNPTNLRTDAVVSGLIPQQAARAGVQVYTQSFSGGQIWVFVRNGQIINGGVNPLTFIR